MSHHQIPWKITIFNRCTYYKNGGFSMGLFMVMKIGNFRGIFVGWFSWDFMGFHGILWLIGMDPRNLGMFLREIAAISRISGPFIVRLPGWDSFKTQDLRLVSQLLLWLGSFYSLKSNMEPNQDRIVFRTEKKINEVAPKVGWSTATSATKWPTLGISHNLLDSRGQGATAFSLSQTASEQPFSRWRTVTWNWMNILTVFLFWRRSWNVKL
jgi:hypothetical protein